MRAARTRGRVAFISSATNLVPGRTDSNAGGDIFLFDRATGTVTLASHIPGSAVTTGNGWNENASISGNGAFVGFTSIATNLVPGRTTAMSVTTCSCTTTPPGRWR